MSKSKQKTKQSENTNDSKSVEFNQPGEIGNDPVQEQPEPGKPEDVINEGEPVIPDPNESIEDNLASIEKNTPTASFAGPVYTEDPDEPNPIGMVSHICALCYNFPCKDYGVNKNSHQPFHSTALQNSYEVPLCLNKSNFLMNFEPIPLVDLSRSYTKNPPAHDKARQIAEAERDKAEMWMYQIKERLTYTMARMETIMRKFSDDTPQSASALRAAVADILKTMVRDILPDYKYDN